MIWIPWGFLIQVYFLPQWHLFYAEKVWGPSVPGTINSEIPQNSSEYQTNIDLFWNQNVLKPYKDGTEIRSSRSEVFCKKGVPKDFKNSEKISVPESRGSGKGNSLWILWNFQGYIFCRTSVNAYLREIKQWKNILT